MKKIIAVNAGPRKNWNTAQLINAACEGAKEEGAEVKVYNMYDLEKYSGCISCFGCKLEKNLGHCICKDGLTPVLEDIRTADGLIIGSPNYLSDVTAAFRAIYEGAGYRVVDSSVVTGEGIDALREACRGKVNLFSGESGVGKSSLIKALDPTLDPKIGQISTAHLQGKHTTSLYEMYIGKYFPEMLRASEGCRFTPCTHTHEPGCAVKAAVDTGTISAERYNSYLGMLEEDQKFR